MAPERALRDLRRFAVDLAPGGLRVHRAVVTLDERQDGEPVTRMTLLLDEPGGDTWEADLLQELRTSLARRATELELPPVSLTLVPESEADAFDGLPTG